MMIVPDAGSIQSTKAYDAVVAALYLKVKRRVEELSLPPLPVIAVTGNEAPASRQFQEAIAALYGVGYSLKMGLKFGKLPQPAGYFDYRVGALEALWWASEGALDISNPATLRWQAYLMVPSFITAGLLEEAVAAVRAKHPETDYSTAHLTTIAEGRVVQMLHIGPYDQEQATVAALREYADGRGLEFCGRHHEIYISDPGRTPPEKLKTVIRQPVRPKGAG